VGAYRSKSPRSRSLIAEHDHASIKAATLNTVSAAAQLGSAEIHVLVAGHNASGAAQAAGVAKVLLADGAQFADQAAEEIAPQVVALAGGTPTSSRPQPPTAKTSRPA
jgi:electron transfer flavoprotein alpha subunit